MRAAPHAALDWVEFVSLRDHHVRLDLPSDENGEVAIKRSIFDSIVLDRAREHLSNGRMADYAAEVAEHKRDPYSLVEEIVRKAGQ